MFEYILINQWELYNEYFIIYPKWYRRFSKHPHTEKELQDIIGLVYGAAKTTVDKLRALTKH